MYGTPKLNNDSDNQTERYSREVNVKPSQKSDEEDGVDTEQEVRQRSLELSNSNSRDTSTTISTSISMATDKSVMVIGEVAINPMSMPMESDNGNNDNYGGTNDGAD